MRPYAGTGTGVDPGLVEEEVVEEVGDVEELESEDVILFERVGKDCDPIDGGYG